MDFLKILRSFEEFVFEATTWLLFYPRTLWRVVWRPLATMDYSDREQADTDDKRYDDGLSPPIVLLITLLLINLVAQALHVPKPTEETGFAQTVLNSPQNLILFRSLVFSLSPLIAAATLVKRQGHMLTRETLRAPFYAQCYLAAPTAIFVSTGIMVFERADVADMIGLSIIAAGGAWFAAAEVRWFRKRLDVSTLRAFLLTLWVIFQATAYLGIVVLALVAPALLL